ncbi:hypothetical protein PCAR4_150227 [Paraburkholderia caribensis]|nr:hypothetical protein PCAR4_150227 [Paraburkholderia caribensis]
MAHHLPSWSGIGRRETEAWNEGWLALGAAEDFIVKISEGFSLSFVKSSYLREIFGRRFQKTPRIAPSEDFSPAEDFTLKGVRSSMKSSNNLPVTHQ